MVRRMPVRLETIKVVLSIWTETKDVRCKEHATYPRGHAMLLHDVLPRQLGKAAATPDGRPLMHGKRCTGKNDTGMPPSVWGFATELMPGGQAASEMVYCTVSAADLSGWVAGR